MKNIYICNLDLQLIFEKDDEVHSHCWCRVMKKKNRTKKLLAFI